MMICFIMLLWIVLWICGEWKVFMKFWCWSFCLFGFMECDILMVSISVMLILVFVWVLGEYSYRFDRIVVRVLRSFWFIFVFVC